MTPIQAVNNNPFAAYAVQGLTSFGGGSSVAKIGTPGGGQTGSGLSTTYGVNEKLGVGSTISFPAQSGIAAHDAKTLYFA